jgi:WD40 repeat protein
VSGSEDGFVYLWDIKKGKLVGTLGTRSMAFGHLNEVNEVQTVGSNIVVSASDDCSVLVWNLIN